MSVITDIADAVVKELNAGSFGQSFTAERLYVPLFELPEMKDLHVTVVPKGLVINPGSRSRNMCDYAIDVAVQKKFTEGDNAELDPLLALVEEIADFFRLRKLSEYAEATWLRTENEPVYAREHFEELRQFTSVLTFTFRMHR